MDVLEDIGYYCVDNIPPDLIPKFAELCRGQEGGMDKVAIGADVRTVQNFQSLRDAIAAFSPDVHCRVILVDASTSVLIKRFQETRRKHPLAGKVDGPIEDLIKYERRLLEPMFSIADFIIDTSTTTTAQLWNILIAYLLGRERELEIQIVSFGYRGGLPPEADMVFDMRCLENPYYVDELRDLTGLDGRIERFVLGADGTMDYLGRILDLVRSKLPARDAARWCSASAARAAGTARSSPRAGLPTGCARTAKTSCCGTGTSGRKRRNDQFRPGGERGNRAGDQRAVLPPRPALRAAAHGGPAGARRADAAHGKRRGARLCRDGPAGLFRGPAAVQEIYAAYQLDPRAPALRVNGHLTARDCCKTAFLRGMFLGCGTVPDPGKGYGLEFDCKRYHLARDMGLILAELGYPPKTGRRGGGYVVYYRESGAIEDLLGMMGATRSVFKLMDVKIEKEIRNNVNRQNNCDVANAGKQAAAAALQLQTVTELDRQGRLSALPPQLRRLALLRMQHPELSLTELGGLCEPPIGKSTAQRRFARIREFAQQDRHGQRKGKDKDQSHD